MSSNKQRVARAAVAVKAYCTCCGVDEREDPLTMTFVDLLTDLRHFANKRGIDFTQANTLAAQHFIHEQKSTSNKS